MQHRLELLQVLFVELEIMGTSHSVTKPAVGGAKNGRVWEVDQLDKKRREKSRFGVVTKGRKQPPKRRK